MVELFEKELVDCDALSSGCTTGRVTYAFQYLMKNGVSAEKDYVYKGQAAKCGTKAIEGIVDCGALSSGCTTGSITYTFQYVMKNGVSAEKDYVYKGQAGKCDSKGKPHSAKIKGYQKVGDGEQNLLEVVAQQLITFGFLFGQIFKSYKRGIFGNLPIKETMDISHGVSLIGYGGEGEDSY
ncbi:hypothetical protein KIW84_057706 [Lathyrus oleraceus]|uniref:Peptidase C1A papain C-terminal domain-containing protein n=1 Tax=Pisum sativum TaxID=3888 RepID=A0A9D5AIJ2_PEA|nr:hypothetical protein KIW84_057706 [Pisum sativum]